MFAWNIASHGYGAQTNLLKNGYPVGVAAITDPRSSSVDDSSTSFAVLRLNTNDKVNVHRYASGRTSSSFFAGWRIDNHHSEYIIIHDGMVLTIIMGILMSVEKFLQRIECKICNIRL